MATTREQSAITAFFEAEDEPTAGEFEDAWHSVCFKIGAEHVVASGVSIDLNDAAVTVAYTVPANTRFVFTRAYIRSLSATAAATIGDIQTGAGVDLVPGISFATIGTDEVQEEKRAETMPFAGPHAAGETIDFEVTTPAGAARTCRLDVLGYLLPLTD